jgi:hypothetical protein
VNTLYNGDNLIDLGSADMAASPFSPASKSFVTNDLNPGADRLDSAHCCEACRCGVGEHAPWCANATLSNWLAAAQSRARILEYASAGPEWSGLATRSKKTATHN